MLRPNGCQSYYPRAQHAAPLSACNLVARAQHAAPLRFRCERYNRGVEHHRRSIRYPGFDYSSHGAYFITISAHHRRCLFGQVEQDRVRLNATGKIVESCWDEIPQHFSQARLDYFVIMPNHFHGIILLVGAQHAAPFPDGHASPVGRLQADSLAAIIRSFKAASTRAINLTQGAPGAPLWQRNYFERIIRDEDELCRTREYIDSNPARWALDHENPDRPSMEPQEPMPWEIPMD